MLCPACGEAEVIGPWCPKCLYELGDEITPSTQTTVEAEPALGDGLVVGTPIDDATPVGASVVAPGETSTADPSAAQTAEQVSTSVDVQPPMTEGASRELANDREEASGFCTQCGAPQHEGHRHCPFCGNRHATLARQSPPPEVVSAVTLERVVGTKYRPSILWTVLGLVLWVIVAAPAAAQLATGNNDLAAAWIALGIASYGFAVTVRFVVLGIAERSTHAFRRAALSPWVWVIASAILSSRAGRHAAAAMTESCDLLGGVCWHLAGELRDGVSEGVALCKCARVLGGAYPPHGSDSSGVHVATLF